MMNNLTEAILNIEESTTNIHGISAINKIVYSNWDHGHSSNLGEFYNNFIAPRLPDSKVVLEWNKMSACFENNFTPINLKT